MASPLACNTVLMIFWQALRAIWAIGLARPLVWAPLSALPGYPRH